MGIMIKTVYEDDLPDNVKSEFNIVVREYQEIVYLINQPDLKYHELERILTSG